MSSPQPTDAVITGCAYEEATNSLGVLEEGSKTRRWISTEMLCALDNFVKVLLFSDRIFVGGCAGEQDGAPIPKDPTFGASSRAKRCFDEEGIFQSITNYGGDGAVARARIGKVLQPVDPLATPWIALTCTYAKKPLVIRQELVTMDVYFIEYLIEFGGLERFKPVFPGEHLYLGLRQQALNYMGATHTIADIAGGRSRAVVREKMTALNELVSIGAPPLPTLPPIFLGRILRDCSDGAEIVPTLLKVRKSPAMVRFRNWTRQCMQLVASEDLSDRTKAQEAYTKLKTFSPTDDLSTADFGKGVLDVAKHSAEGDLLGILGEVVSPVLKYLDGFPLSALRQLSGKADPQQVDTFLKRQFGDKFSRSEMDCISTFLGLPDNVSDWKTADASFSVNAGRVDGSAPNLSRPYSMTTGQGLDVLNAQKDFDELFEQSIPLKDFLGQREENEHSNKDPKHRDTHR